MHCILCSVKNVCILHLEDFSKSENVSYEKWKEQIIQIAEPRRFQAATRRNSRLSFRLSSETLSR